MKNPKVVFDSKTGHVYFSTNYVNVENNRFRLIEKFDITEELNGVLNHVGELSRLQVKKERINDGFLKIICLCGSTKFKEEFMNLNALFSGKGHIVLSVGFFMHSDKHEITTEQKEKLDDLHMRKIDLADIVYFINKGGYIGESTKSELKYALDKDKIIIFDEPELGDLFIRDNKSYFEDN